MHFNVQHSLLAFLGTKRLGKDQSGMPGSNHRQEYILDSNSIADSTKKVCYGRNRKENVSLLRAMKVLKEDAEICLRRHREEKSNLEQIVHHLNSQREGMTTSLGSVIAADASQGLVSLRGMHARSDCRHIKSIRRPLAPETTRDHGNRLNLQPNLQSKEGSVIPRAVEREILRRRTKRLNAKRQEQLEEVKQREMQLEDTVGVYTRINMTKGSLNYKGKPKYSMDETRTSDFHETSPRSGKYQYDLPSIEVEQTASLSSKESTGAEKHENTYKGFLPNVRNPEFILPLEDNSTEKISSVVSKLTTNDVKRKLVVIRGKNTVSNVKKDNHRSITQNSFAKDSEKVKYSEDITIFSCKELTENRKDISDEKISTDFVAVDETSSAVNDIKTKEDDEKTTKPSSEPRVNSTKNNTAKLVRTIKNRVILPSLRLQRQTKRANGADHSDFYIESVMKDNITENQITIEPNEEYDAMNEEKSNPLSTGKLQQLIREKVLSQSQKSSKGTNKKTVLLADYVRTLQKHMGIKEVSTGIESNSPDFSATPFIAAGKRFGRDDEHGEEPRLVDRSLEKLQRQILRLPATFTLLDGDLVDESDD